MEKCSDYRGPVKSVRIGFRSRNFLLAAFAIVLSSPGATAQECATVKECSQQMVKLANELIAQNTALSKRVTELEAALEKQRKDVAAGLEKRLETAFKGGVESNPRRLGGATEKCPPGSYMVGMLYTGVSGGGSGYVAEVQPVCKNFN